MLSLLHWVLADDDVLLQDNFPSEWGAPPPPVESAGKGKFSVLYSDVGADFYAKCGPTKALEDGWLCRDPVSTVWNIVSRYGPNLAPDSDGQEWSLLSEEQSTQLWRRDAEIMATELAEDAAKSSTTKATFSFLPHQGVAGYINKRTAVYSDLTDGSDIARIGNWGLARGKTTDQQVKTFATWAVDVRPPPSTLMITRLRVEESDAKELFHKISDEAAKHGIEQVEVWNAPEYCRSVLQRNFGGETTVRENHLPAFKWYGAESPDSVKWAFNEQ